MKSRFLFPHWCRYLGYGCFAADIVFAVVLKVLHTGGFTQEINQPPNHAMILHNDINILLVVFGLLLIAFAKEKLEDEHISQLRLDSLQWAVYANYGIFILCVILFNGVGFLEIVVYNIITPLIFFIIRFRWKIYQLNLLTKQTS
jgi:hypothetical protein